MLLYNFDTFRGQNWFCCCHANLKKDFCLPDVNLVFGCEYMRGSAGTQKFLSVQGQDVERATGEYFDNYVCYYRHSKVRWYLSNCCAVIIAEMFHRSISL